MISYSKHGSWYEWYSTYLLGYSTPYRYELFTDLDHETRDQLINIFQFEITKTAPSISLTEKWNSICDIRQSRLKLNGMLPG